MLIDFVNLLQGTDSSYGFSTGNTLPLAAAPFGMTHWVPETVEADPRRFFSARSHNFAGFRATHQPSPWIGDYGAFRLVPQCGGRFAGRAERAGCFCPEKLELSPDRIGVSLERYGIDAELVPTSRCAILRCRFRRSGVRRLIVDCLDETNEISASGNRITGVARNNSGGAPPGFGCYFVIQCSCRIAASGNTPEGAWFEFDGQTGEIEFRIGTSFLGVDQAGCNLERELDGGFDAIRCRTRELWESAFRRISIDADETRKRTFYSCFYRTLLFPREFHEFDHTGNAVHYSPYDGKKHSGVLYADNGFWDTHRTVYPFLALVFPARCGEILNGWLNAAREGGWFPRWSSPGFRSCMTGTHIDAVFADCAARGVPGVDWRAAWPYLRKNAFSCEANDGLFGRRCLAEYLQFGYVPDDRCEHSAARTMDYAANDFALSRFARLIGEHADADELERRSKYYHNLYNPASGLLQGRNADGSFPAVDPCDWHRCYIEGSSWQCGLAVPHDPEGLAELLGGRAALVARLDAMLAAEPCFTVGAYGTEIHEMAEMALAGFGQYAHSNQPAHHQLWLYAAMGERARATAAIHRVLTELYTPDRFPGDEDNGEMSAWYLLASMGIYPLRPGVAEYVTATAYFERLAVMLENGTRLEIRPGGDCRSITHARLTLGGVLLL